MEEVWRNQGGVGWMGVVLKNKLKELKNCSREWNKVEYGGVEANVNRLVEGISELSDKC